MKASLFLVPVLVLSPLAARADNLPAKPYIVVSGHGELHVAPDLMYVTLTVERTDMDLGVARTDVEQRATKVIELARKLGVADKDISAAAIYVSPQYEWLNHGQQFKGQHVTRSITLTLRAIDRYTDLVNGLIGAGVTRLDAVTPDRSDRRALEEKALQLAVIEAHDKAAGMAATASVSLGPVYSIAEQSGGRSVRPLMMATAEVAGGSPPSGAEYLSGEIEIAADVSVYYLIGN